MMVVERAYFVLLLLYVATPTLSQETAEIPLWAEGIPVSDELQLVNDGDECDLCHRQWQEGLAVAQDKEDTIYVLDLEDGSCEVYSPVGERIEEFKPQGWQPMKRAQIFTSFAANPAGDLFAAASGNKLSLFTRKEVKKHTTLPTFITSLVFAGDLVVAMLPVRFNTEDHKMRPERWPSCCPGWMKTAKSRPRPSMLMLPADLMRWR
jgi:hypothetical protein